MKDSQNEEFVLEITRETGSVEADRLVSTNVFGPYTIQAMPYVEVIHKRRAEMLMKKVAKAENRTPEPLPEGSSVWRVYAKSGVSLSETDPGLPHFRIQIRRKCST